MLRQRLDGGLVALEVRRDPLQRRALGRKLENVKFGMIVAGRVQVPSRAKRAARNAVTAYADVCHQIRRQHPAAQPPPLIIELDDLRPFRSAARLAASFSIMHETRYPGAA